MKKVWLAGWVTLGIGLTLAGVLTHLRGQSCGGDAGKWHFIENRSRGASGGLLTATWSSGDSCTAPRSNQ